MWKGKVVRSFADGAGSVRAAVHDPRSTFPFFSTRFMKRMIWAFGFTMLAACSSQVPPALMAPRDPTAIVLDNGGGYAHEGRQIALQSDGRYWDRRYTDVIGDSRTKYGRYVMNADRTILTLSPRFGQAETLYRVGKYWVRAEDRRRIANDPRLQEISLRVGR
jgi:hypothetical protein